MHRDCAILSFWGGVFGRTDARTHGYVISYSGQRVVQGPCWPDVREQACKACCECRSGVYHRCPEGPGESSVCGCVCNAWWHYSEHCMRHYVLHCELQLPGKTFIYWWIDLFMNYYDWLYCTDLCCTVNNKCSVVSRSFHSIGEEQSKQMTPPPIQWPYVRRITGGGVVWQQSTCDCSPWPFHRFLFLWNWSRSSPPPPQNKSGNAPNVPCNGYKGSFNGK